MLARLVGSKASRKARATRGTGISGSETRRKEERGKRKRRRDVPMAAAARLRTEAARVMMLLG